MVYFLVQNKNQSDLKYLLVQPIFLTNKEEFQGSSN